MPKFRVTYDLAKFRPIKRTEADIAKLVERGYRLAAKDFVNAAVSLVPVVTGMARGSLIPLANWAGTSITIGGTPQIGYLPSGRQVLKGPDLGAKQARKPPYIFRVGNRYIFEFDNRVFHYWLNDLFAMNYKHGQLPTPWRSFEYGMIAFTKRFNTYTRNNISKVLFAHSRVSQGRRNVPVNLKEPE